MIGHRELVRALADMDIDAHSRVIVHAAAGLDSLLGGGAESLVAALISLCETVAMPAFTMRTGVVPPFGPEGNGMFYGEDEGANLDAELFTTDLPVDAELGEAAEVFRRRAGTLRSPHPLLSFCASGAVESLEHQTLDEPLAPIGWLAEFDADVLLIGLDHTANVSLHWAERLAGRKTFVRWALTEGGVATCIHMPGCSQGFNAIERRLGGELRRSVNGPLAMEAVALRDLLNIASAWIREDPRALLCDRPACPTCSAVRMEVRQPDSSTLASSGEDETR